MTIQNQFLDADIEAVRARRLATRRNALRRLLMPWTSYIILTSIVVVFVTSAVTAFAANVPDGIDAGDAKIIAHAHGEGLQIYECKVDTEGHANWQFREPIATLISDGKTIGRHFAGPSWEFLDGSRIVGKVASQVSSPPNDIPLLRLDVVKHDGTGDLSSVDTVQRLNTKGGVFSGACDTVGALHLEPYSADYVFLTH